MLRDGHRHHENARACAIDRTGNAHVTDLIRTRENSESKKQHIAFILARIDPVLETIDNRLQTAVNEKPTLPGKLSLPIRTHIEAVQAFYHMLRRQVLDAGPSIFPKLDLKSVNANGLNTLDSSYALYDTSVGVLDDLVEPASTDSINARHFL